jgi:hypothetical protein
MKLHLTISEPDGRGGRRPVFVTNDEEIIRLVGQALSRRLGATPEVTKLLRTQSAERDPEERTS